MRYAWIPISPTLTLPIAGRAHERMSQDNVNVQIDKDGCYSITATDGAQCAQPVYVVADTLFYTGATYEGLPVWNTTAPFSSQWRQAITKISWKPATGAYGYNIYHGIAPGKMYNAITVLGEQQYDFRGLDLGNDYYFSIEALGETGVSPCSNALKPNK